MKLILLILVTAAIIVTMNTSFACDTDSECGVGGTCIKREKRGRGVCYGGDLNQAAPDTPQQPTVVDPFSMPTVRPEGACMVTEECPAGMECVITGIWGACTVL